MSGVEQEYTTNIRDYDFEAVCGKIKDKSYPNEYEIPRENTGTAKDQGDVGACVACVIAQIAEELHRRQFGESEEFSEGYIYGSLRSDSSQSDGMIVSVALEKWAELGALPKKYFDLLYEMPEIKETVQKFPELADIAKKYRISGYAALNYADKKKRDLAVKQALTKYKYGLLAVSKNGFLGGTHCILLTGWNDSADKYKYKNSRAATFAEIGKDKINQIYLILGGEIKLPFEDVSDSDWFYRDVRAMYFSGLMNGTSDITFEPGGPMTRAEVCVVLNRILKQMDERFSIFNKVLNEKIY